MPAELTPELVTLCEWIRSKRRTDTPVAISPDTDLFKTHVIDSLDFAEFLFVIEEVYGRTIELESISLDTFRTLSSISAHYSQQGGSHV